MGGALMFHYTGRGSSSPTERRIVGLGAGVRGHWYLYGFDLDKEAHRVFRMDRIHSHIRPLRRMTPSTVPRQTLQPPRQGTRRRT